jgi:hypothetical protein
MELVEFLKENLIFNVLIFNFTSGWTFSSTKKQPPTYYLPPPPSYQPIAYIPLFFTDVSFMPLIHF